jgi:hypothetical protein
MFDLEQSIAEWRRRLAAGGMTSPALLDELESHLREDVERQSRSDVVLRESFDAAVARIGQAAALKREFAKSGGVHGFHEQLKHLVLVLFGVPIPPLVANMNTSYTNSDLEPRWATYLKAALFAAPAAMLWAISFVYVGPELRQVCMQAGAAMPAFYNTAYFLTYHFAVIGAAVILALGLLEWRSQRWPRYRRAAIGAGVFISNAAVLILIATMMVLALFAASTLPHHIQ